MTADLYIYVEDGVLHLDVVGANRTALTFTKEMWKTVKDNADKAWEIYDQKENNPDDTHS